MARNLIFLCIALLAVSSVHAAYYVTIVDDDAPASDVVNAANFAGSMKSSAGASFTGVLASEADMKIAVRSDPVMQVWFDGTDVEIIADEDEFDEQISYAQRYLLAQGFDVEIFSPESRPVRAKVETEKEEQEPEETIVLPEVDDEVVVEEREPEPEVPQVEQEDVREPEQERNVFVRLWRWFAQLFS